MKDRRLHLTTEVESSEQKVLIIASRETHFVTMLKRRLEVYDSEVFVSHVKPVSLDTYFATFFINVSEKTFKEVIAKHKNQVVFIFMDKRELSETCAAYIQNDTRGQVKILSIESSFDHYTDDIEKVLWFSFARGKENYLSIVRPKPPKPKVTPAKKHVPVPVKKPFRLDWETMQYLMQPKFTISFILFAIVFIHILFIPVLGLATYFNYSAVQQLKNRNIVQAEKQVNTSKVFLSISRRLYSLVRPSLSLFSLAILPDNAFLINQSLHETITGASSIYRHSQEFSELMNKPVKSTDDVEYMAELKNTIIDQGLELNDEISVLAEKLPEWNEELKQAKQQMRDINKMTATSSKYLPYIDWVMGKDRERTYLLLFANNMELRPGGGFIGSFAVVSVKQYAITDMRVYDVYDADGQLTAHIRPPSPIRDYLNQPHWFLRDSAFSPDFYENYQQASFFLEKTMDMKDFDGVILITTTAIQNVLGAMGELYVPDFQENINSSNFYMKAQLYAEKDFFPGSTQKKTFLASVMNQMIIELPQVNPVDMFSMVKKSLDEKQVVAYFDNQELQKEMDASYWSGRTIKPRCTSTLQNCIVDFVFPYDANLGVNKANFYVTKAEKLEVSMNEKGVIHNKLTISYKNNSYKNIFPGGRYKNYLQVLLPPNIRIQRIRMDNKLVEDYDLQGGEYTKIGFLTEVPEGDAKEITVEYTINQSITKGNGVYQLIVQKQIGSSNTDFQLVMELPKNVYVVNKNFSPIVKDKKILYNTSLSADKIFYIEFYIE